MSAAVIGRPKARGVGHLIYRCWTCGEPIEDEVLFVDESQDWADTSPPPYATPRTTTHHVRHLDED